MKALDRLLKLTTEAHLEKLKQTTVLIVGVGGVGGYAVEALVRSGIGHLICIDHDTVEKTNLNRQIIATKSTIGMLKVDAFKKRILDINLGTIVTDLPIYLTEENIALLNEYPIDYIVDACDTVGTKVALIRYAKEHQIPIISSMGTGNRIDPSKLEIISLKKTENDPLAKAVRKKLREENMSLSIDVVWSREQPKKVEGVIASTAFVPGCAGLLCASYVVNNILKEDVE